MALTLDGTCMMSPLSSATPASIASQVTFEASRDPVISPSASSVSVV